MPQTHVESTFCVELKPCPPGYILAPVYPDSDVASCDCNLDNLDILNCEGESITLQVSLST